MDIPKVNPQTSLQPVSSQVQSQVEAKTSLNKLTLISVCLVAILLGIFSGFYLSSNKPDTASKAQAQKATEENANVQIDENLIKDTVSGVLREGGVNGEGTHKIETGNGDVAILSGSLYLDSFIGNKVTVWGRSISSPNVDWLIDVAKVKVQ